MLTRRQALGRFLFGAGGVGLKALATGVPLSFLTRPLAARAETTAGGVDAGRAQYLILSTSGGGDPFNVSAPGTYGHPDIVRAPHPAMDKVALHLGEVETEAARVFASLPQWALDRTCFIHHPTLTNNHPNHANVLRLMGQTVRGEMAPSLFAKALAPALDCVQAEPVSAGAGGIFTFEGKNLPDLEPTALAEMFARSDNPLAGLQNLRDTTVDELSALLQSRGTKAQRLYLDQVVQSRRQARALSDDILDMFSAIRGDGAEGRNIAAVALIKMNVAPVVFVKIPFGGDNHKDTDLLEREVPEHVDGMAHIADLFKLLADNGLSDKVTFGVFNVFGRTLVKGGLVGRSHWGAHHVTMLTGKNVKAGVIGGIVPTGNKDDYAAAPFDPNTGGVDEAGLKSREALASVGKTLGAALGVTDAVLDEGITSGVAIKAALR